MIINFTENFESFIYKKKNLMIQQTDFLKNMLLDMYLDLNISLDFT